MPQMTPTQARVIDPVITGLIQGYKHPVAVGNTLFPRVPVTARGGQVLSFGREDFVLYTTARAPGANTKRVDIAQSTSSYALEDHSLEGKLPNEIAQEARNVLSVDLARRATNVPMRSIGLTLEKQQADIATTAGSYAAANKVTLASTTQWSHASGVPKTNVDTARDAISAAIGVVPNTMVLSAQAWKALRNNPQMTDQIKYTSSASISTEIAADILELDRVVVARAVYWNGTATVPIWGNFAVVAYVGQASGYEEPSYGYTYVLNGYPMAEPPYEERNSKSRFYPVTDSRIPVMTSMNAGYLFTDPN